LAFLEKLVELAFIEKSGIKEGIDLVSEIAIVACAKDPKNFYGSQFFIDRNVIVKKVPADMT